MNLSRIITVLVTVAEISPLASIMHYYNNPAMSPPTPAPEMHYRPAGRQQRNGKKNIVENEPEMKK